MTSAIHVDDIELTAFRGVCGPLPLPLTASLTVLYAANGTGKSSVCQAAEWMLTGDIDGIDDADIGFRLETVQTTRVVATVSAGGDRKRVERNSSGWRLDSPNGGQSAQWTRTKFFNYLAPTIGQGLPGLDPRIANTVQRDWLKGAHFLYGTNLSVLIDSDKPSLDQRKQIFADLLGTGHMNRIINDLEDRYSPKIRQNANLLQRIHIKPREEALAALATSDSASDLTVAERELTVARNALGLTATEAAELPLLQTRLVEIQALIAQRSRALASLRTDVRRMHELWPAREQQTDFQRTTEINRHRLAVKLLGWEGRERRVVSEADRIGRRIDDERIRRQRFDHAAALLAQTLQEAEPLIESQWGDRLSRDTLPELLPSVAWSAAQREQKRRALAKLRDQVAAQAEHRLTLAALGSRRQMEDADPITPDQFAAAEQDVTLKAAIHRECTLAYERAAGPLQQLRLVGLRVLEVLNDDETACPLCRHDWDKPHDLHDAIHETAAGVHSALRQLEIAKQEAEDNLTAARDRLARIVERLDALREVDAQMATLQQQVDALDDVARLFDLPSDESLWAEQVALLLKELATADRVADLLVHLDTADILLGRDDPLPLTAAARRAVERLRQEAESSRSAVERFEGRIAKARTILSKIGTELVRCRHELTRINSERARLEALVSESRALWKRLAGMVPDAGNPDDTLQWLVAEEDKVTRAEQHHAAAQAILDSSTTLQQRRTLTSELDRYRRDAAYLNSQNNTANDAIRALKEFRDGYARRQLQQLLPVVNALFARVHANRVVDDIVSAGEDPLLWLADESSGGLDPQRHFSQGQRQDLALAIFIARASRLGGTFFMDEPLVHLDDLNRVAVLDILRVIALTQPRVRLVLTTASHPLVRHLQEKFAQIRTDNGERFLKVITLEGSPRHGVRLLSRTDEAS